MLPFAHVLFVSLACFAPNEPPPRLEFKVVDANCEPAPVDANDSWSGWNPPARVLFCVRCPKGETPRPGWNTPESVGSTSPGRGDTMFLVEPGERYVYAYVGKDVRPIEGEVTIAPHTQLTVRELRIDPEPVRTQMLRVHVTRPDGSPIAHDFQVAIESLVTGLTLFQSELQGNLSRYGDLLPVGRYRVRVETEENFPGCATGWQPKPAPFGDWVEEVDLAAASGPVELEASMWFGGKLHLTLDVPRGTLPIQETWGTRFPAETSFPELQWLRLGSRGPGARVTLRPDPQYARAPRERGMADPESNTVRFFLERPRLPLFARLQFDAILPDDTQTSADWIPPGAYIARIEACDYQPVEAKVRIQIDETTELRVQLTPR